jgi:hypothetical protein
VSLFLRKKRVAGRTNLIQTVMAGLVPAIHTHRFAWVFMGRRDKPGDDEVGV